MALPRYEGPEDDEDFDAEPAQVIHMNDEIMARLRHALEQEDEPDLAEDEQEPPYPTEHYRHPMLNIGFWCSFVAFIVLMVTTSSFIQYNILEPLVYAGMFFNLMAMLFNLCRDRTHVTIFRRPLVIRFHIGWPDFGTPKPTPTLRELQIRHGVKVED